MKKSSIIFLDIDGVLNTSKEYYDYSHAPRWSDPRSLINAPDDPHVKLLFGASQVAALNSIADAVPDVEIVVSSTWRHFYTTRTGRAFEQLVRLLSDVGVKIPVIDVTPTEIGPRGPAIHRWLYDRVFLDAAAYVILDDEPPYVFTEPTRGRLVQTDPEVGLNMELARRAAEILLDE